MKMGVSLARAPMGNVTASLIWLRPPLFAGFQLILGTAKKPDTHCQNQQFSWFDVVLQLFLSVFRSLFLSAAVS